MNKQELISRSKAIGRPSGGAIKLLRDTACLTQQEAGALVHSTRVAWNLWERDKNAMPLAKWELFLIKVERLITK